MTRAVTALVAPAHSSVERLRDELLRVSRLVYERGLSVGISGNLSVRVPQRDAILIKATGACLGAMTPDDTVLVSLRGRILEGVRPPSKEVAWHLGVYRARVDVSGIVHAHPPYATAWAVAGRIPSAVHTAARELLGDVALVDLAPPGSARLAALVTEAFSGPVRAALLREHGIVAVGPDLTAAYHLAEHLEDNAKVALLSRQLSEASCYPGS
jgi:L-fuculose-phosphate aldolase